MNEARRGIRWPTWLTGQTIAFIGTMIAFGVFLQNGFSSIDANMRALRAEMRADMGALRTEIRDDLAALRTELHADMVALRTELHADMDALRTELRGEMADLRAELRGEMKDLRAELKGDIHGLQAELKQLRVDMYQGLGKLGDRLGAVERDVAVIKTRQAEGNEQSAVSGVLPSLENANLTAAKE